MKDAYIAKAACVATNEPECLPCGAQLKKTEMLRDPFGMYWCPKHRRRGELLNWAAKHGYPAIQFTGCMRYAIGVPGATGNDELWKWAITLGSDDMFEAAWSAVMGNAESEKAS